MSNQILELMQGTPEWLALRKTKITASDAPIIMGVSPWKTKRELYFDKISEYIENTPNEAQLRGIELEPIARELYNLKVGLEHKPKVIVKEWLMASLDGMSIDGHIVEIKCPGEKDHSLALQGIIPEKYYPQLQHQMFVCDVEEMDYFSFDGIDGVILTVKRDDPYIDKMLLEELAFYDRLLANDPPPPGERDYIDIQNPLFDHLAIRYRNVSTTLKELEKEEQDLRNELISLSNGMNVKSSGITLGQYERKGNIDYSAIPELKSVDLEQYRRPSSKVWRIITE